MPRDDQPMSSQFKFRRWVLAADLLWLGVSMVAAWLLRYGAAWNTQPRPVAQAFVLIPLGAALLWAILWSSFELDGYRGGWRFPAIASHLLLTVGIVMVTLLAIGYLLRVYVSRLALSYFGILTLAGFLLIRVAACAIVNARYRSGAVRRIVVMGSGPVAQEVAARFECHPEMLCMVVGFLMPEDASLQLLPSPETTGDRRMTTSSILELLERRNVDEIVFAMSRNGNPGVAELMDQCVKQGIGVSVVPQPYELYLSAPELTDLDGIPILRLRHSLWGAEEPLWKRVMDLAFAIPLLLISLPVMLCSALVLRLKKGAGFCREERYGMHGRKFSLYRLNSPRRATDLALYELIMQHLSVTELPQLFNVLRGDMSLVGPRPEGFESVRHYTDWHRQRLNVKPGMTGLAQVHGLREQNGLEDKTRHDLRYILSRSPFQDLSLLLQTIWVLLRRLGHLGKLEQQSADQVQHHPPSTSLPASPAPQG
jgi:lipopolysaccharide/colanic/teichoic acid biosynthesis glycosyltransferase